MEASATAAKEKSLSDMLGVDKRYKDRPKLDYVEDALVWASKQKNVTTDQIITQMKKRNEWEAKWNSDKYNPLIIPDNFKEDMKQALKEAITEADSIAVQRATVEMESKFPRNVPTPVQTAADSTGMPSEFNINLETKIEDESINRSQTRFSSDRWNRGFGNPVYGTP